MCNVLRIYPRVQKRQVVGERAKGQTAVWERHGAPTDWSSVPDLGPDTLRLQNSQAGLAFGPGLDLNVR
jgi:hypothetical protein